MCGRYSLFTDYAVLIERFTIETSKIDQHSYSKSYNVAPSQQVLSIINDGDKNRLGELRWGLIPSWAKDAKIGYKMINARAETVAEKPSFRNAFKKRRCLVVADSFYEWQRASAEKIPMRIKLKTGEPFAFAAIWESWTGPDNKIINSCSIITTSSNVLMESIHDRMPVILSKEDEKTWLDPRVEDIEILKTLLKPYRAEDMEAYRVSEEVNSPKNNKPELIEKVG
ncbi:SOS response-associated peptidase [Planococcus faecalis]|uniref:Abasic site processing protein n=1 Tax=Planococcus faecalis TaxID=1598147 RepID=A0ABN4XR03_9BACL|nr:SOS response-associated peptidase [Planococcus faecalis]AQU80462.1 hypothetical protein AJGP001_14750 [Planococcus faecalis]OHX54782.1 hypothetical protein BB777_05405 [Planococcus faecalis]